MTPLESPIWYRVAQLAPKLRDHVKVRRHSYRAQRWYLLEDRASGRNHRIDAAAYSLVALMNGQRTMQHIWSLLDERDGEQAPTQDQAVELLGRLHAADIVQCELPPDTAELFDRHRRHERSRLLNALRSPFFVRIGLIDPDRWLQRWTPRVDFLFTRAALAGWTLLLALGLLLAGANFGALSAAAPELVSPLNLLLLWLAYPLVKLLHELGHALAVRHWGGEVHELGVMLLVFVPVPYVDASAANAFESKWARMVVSGAGIAVELALAALAVIVWLVVEPGLLQMLALDVILIGGISTVLFNGNPLLRFDGYYLLADALEIPNLGSRAQRYWNYLFRRYVAGISTTRSPVRAAGERRWFVCYGLAASIYRLFILAVIVLFVSGVSLTAGIVLGAWALIGQLVLPGWQRLSALQRDPQLRERHGRIALASTAAVSLAAALLLAPVPYRTLSEGIVWPVDDAQVRTGVDCFVESLASEPGQHVSRGDPLLLCSEPTLEFRVREAEARVAELRARYVAESQVDRVRARLIADQISAAEAQWHDALATERQLTVRSPGDGVFVVPRAADLPGRFLAQGELVGHVIAPQALGVRVAVQQSDIGLIRERGGPIAVRWVGQSGRVAAADLIRAPAGATTVLPGAALGMTGGGAIVVDAADASGRKTLEPVFVLELGLSTDELPRLAGDRVRVRFDHGATPLAIQWYRSARQLLLRRLAV